MTKKFFFLLSLSYFLSLTALFFYSFTQIDLNLTISQQSLLQIFQKFFIQIGYFQRPLSTVIFLIILTWLFVFYLLFLLFINRKKINGKKMWFLILATNAILIFSYPAFSYDIFNYMFDARIFTHYSLNPYFFKALDFPFDSWTRFMHWTHRNYPYGPTWLLITIPLSYLGFGKFILTLFNFKLLAAIANIGSIYLIGRILEKTNPQKKILGMAIFAFNPLVIIENLVSAHHDIVMIFFALLSIYYFLVRKKFNSVLAFLISAGIKYVTIFLLPIFIFGFQKKMIFILSGLTFLFVLTQREVQPWYFLWVLPLIALNSEIKFLVFLAVSFSFGLLLRYAPFLYYGDWNSPVPTINFWFTLIPVVFAVTLYTGLLLRQKKFSGK